MTSTLFRHIAALHEDRPWGSLLDAGTGVNSALWSTALNTTRWTAVTASRAHGDQVLDNVGGRLRAQDRLLVGDWTDPDLLKDETYDTVLADYLLGAVEGFAPYFQEQLFARLLPHVGGRLYVVGLDPYVLAEPKDDVGHIVWAIGRLRDVCLTLAGETPYREYPAEWASDMLEASGFRVLSARRFQNRYRETWVNGQLDMAVRRLAKIGSESLRRSLAEEIEGLRAQGLELCARHEGLRHGADYVLACEPA